MRIKSIVSLSTVVAFLGLSSPTQADVLLDWNLNGTQAAASAGGNNGTGANGYARSLAIANLAVYDAVNSITPTHKPYVATVATGGPADKDAAIIEASYQTLATLIPSQAANLLTKRNAALALIPAGTAKDNGIAVGQQAASNILSARNADGSAASPPTFTGTTATGLWRPTPGTYGVGGASTFAPVNNASAANPTWSSVVPFGLPANWKSLPAFQVAAPPAVGTAAYNTSLAKTKDLGSASSATRTADQTQIAQWWYPGSTITWNDIARTVIASKSLSVEDEARDLALVNIALQDSRIAAWNGKFDSGYSLWRPITAIQDASAGVNQDASWQPLLPTPNHPSYVSGHGTSGGAAAAVLKTLFGDNNSFTVASPSVWLPTPGTTRSFTSFSQAERENNDSRIYAGIHFDFDQSAGTTLGESVGNYIAANALAVPEPTVPAMLTLAAFGSFLRRRARASSR